MIIDKRLVEDIYLGNPITDEELKAALKFYGGLVESLDCLGLEYKLPANAARNVLYRLEGFNEARKRA